MAKFRVHNQTAIAALLHGTDYLAKKFRQAEAGYGNPMEAIQTDLVDDKGQVWRLTFGTVSDKPATPPTETPTEGV